jgi:hypothetical protein
MAPVKAASNRCGGRFARGSRKQQRWRPWVVMFVPQSTGRKFSKKREAEINEGDALQILVVGKCRDLALDEAGGRVDDRVREVPKRAEGAGHAQEEEPRPQPRERGLRPRRHRALQHLDVRLLIFPVRRTVQ